MKNSANFTFTVDVIGVATLRGFFNYADGSIGSTKIRNCSEVSGAVRGAVLSVPKSAVLSADRCTEAQLARHKNLVAVSAVAPEILADMV